MKFLLWLINLIYAFKVWGIGWGLINIIFPVAILWDFLAHIAYK